MYQIEINCPSCKSRGYFEISEDFVKTINRGIFAINIAAHTICTHTFIAYIDKNLEVRDYFVADFQVEIPELSKEAQEFALDRNISEKKDLDNDFDVDIIKLNLSATIITYIIKSILSKQKILYISDLDYLNEGILNFFNYLTEDSFELNFSITTRENYEKNIKDYNDWMVFEGYEVIRDYNKIINNKNLVVEKQIVNKFITESDKNIGLTLLKGEMRKACKLAQKIVKVVNDMKNKNENINIFNINKILENEFTIKIESAYINFLTEIVKSYFGIQLPSLSECFLGFL